MLLMTLILATPISVSAAPPLINCLKSPSWNGFDFAEVCKSVIDLLKIKRSEFVTINCLGPLEDGYTINQCESVDIAAQFAARNQELQRRAAIGWGGPRLACVPETFAGKSEDCFDKDHKLKGLTVGRLKISYLSDETKYMGSSSDKERFCIVSGIYGLYWGDDAERTFSADYDECRTLLKFVGKTAEVKVAGDHICKVTGPAKPKGPIPTFSPVNK